MTTVALETQRLPFVDIPQERRRGLGVLTVRGPAGKLALPLAGVQIAATVGERVAGVTLTETFQNPYAEHLEATYIFPLPGGAAVSDFQLQVGARVIRGVVKERGEARATYQAALDQGKRAALLEQERDDVFTVQVGNLPPGEQVSVTLTYSERLPFFEDGTTELRLPLVVAPRYIPGTPLPRAGVGSGVEDDTDVVGDASRITPPRLAKGFDPKVSLSIHARIEGGSVASLSCSQHATRTKGEAGAVEIQLAREDEPLDRDFVLRWQVAGASVEPQLLVHRAAAGPCAAVLSLAPPRQEGFLGAPRDVVFVVDRSGSMQGVKMTSAARACALLLRTLGPRDRFAIAAFDDVVDWDEDLVGGKPRCFHAADEAGLERGEKFLRGIDARGGTELDAALAAAIGAFALRGGDTGGRVPVIVLLTDGQVGDESRILQRAQRSLGDARVFTVGIDTAVNEGFLRRLAALGGGTSTFVEPGAALEDALRAVGREIGTPLVTDLTIADEGAGIESGSLTPARMPDLFAGRAASVFLRLRGPGKLRVSGKRADGSRWEQVVEAREVTLPALGHLWAKRRIVDLEDRYRIEPESKHALKDEIVALALAHTLLCRFTAFVVVDEAEVVNQGGRRREVTQPVELPARWEMDESIAGLHAASLAGGGGGQGLGGPPRSMPMPAVTAAAPAPFPARPPASPSPKKQARPSGMADKAKGALSAIFGKPEREEAAQDGGVAPAKPTPRPADRAPVEKAFAAFLAALQDVQVALGAGRAPSADALEKARAELVRLLSASPVASELPALQRYLRAAAVELVAALRTPGITAAAARAVLDRHGKDLDAARAELAGPASFWEGSV